MFPNRQSSTIRRFCRAGFGIGVTSVHVAAAMTMCAPALMPALLALLLVGPPVASADTPPTISPLKTVNVVDYGAVGDGHTVNTDALQKALDACAAAGGGVVRVPTGTFLTGTIALRDKETLALDAGATLLGSMRVQDYRPQHLIVADGAKNVAIVGPGTVDGQGFAFWTKSTILTPGDLKKIHYARIHYWKHNAQRAGHLVVLSNCTNVRISNVTLQNADGWTCHLLNCDNVVVDGVRIRNPLHGPNTDGIDVDGSQDVAITNCDIVTGDDAVCLKNRLSHVAYPHACKNVTISRCTLVSPTNGFKIGTETYGDFENIVFEDSVVQAGDPNDPLCKETESLTAPDFYGDALGPESGIAVESADGSHIHGVTVRNITMHNVQFPIFIRLEGRGTNPVDRAVKAPTGTIDGVSISNVTADGAWGPSIIAGIPGHPVQGVTISNLHVVNIGAGYSPFADLDVPEEKASYPSPISLGLLPASSLYIRHAENVNMTGISVTNAAPDTRRAVIVDDVSGLTLAGFSLDALATTNDLILLNNVRNSQIGGDVPRNTKTWVTVSGPRSSAITLAPAGQGHAERIVALGADAAPNAATVRP
jgi:hypothetical protein